MTILLYTVFLARSLTPASIPGYLNIIKLIHEEQGMHNPLDNWQLRSLKRGIQRVLGKPPKQKLPITVDILHLIYKQVDLSIAQHQAFWAACLVAFFAFLRKSTLLPKSASSVSHALCISDVDLAQDRSIITLHIRHTKMIQFGQRQLNIPLAAIPESNLCPVSAVVRLLATLPENTVAKYQPLFSYVNGEGIVPMTHSVFISMLKCALLKADIDPSGYSGHSFRRGGCTHAFGLGVSPYLIKLRGDWKSNCFERYITVKEEHNLLLAKSLAAVLKH